MRICPLCNRAPRGNDPMGSVQVFPGNPYGHYVGHYMACMPCCALHYPSRPDGSESSYAEAARLLETPTDLRTVPRSYPGEMDRSEKGMDNVPAWYCEVCRLFMREDDKPEAMRLYPEDFSIDHPDLPILFPRGECVHHREGYCIRPGCGWSGPYRDYCPECWENDRQTVGINMERLLDGMKRVCEWHGDYQNPCPACGGETIRRERVFYSCGECRDKFKQIIFDRMKRKREIPARTTIDFMRMAGAYA